MSLLLRPQTLPFILVTTQLYKRSTCAPFLRPLCCPLCLSFSGAQVQILSWLGPTDCSGGTWDTSKLSRKPYSERICPDLPGPSPPTRLHPSHALPGMSKAQLYLHLLPGLLLSQSQQRRLQPAGHLGQDLEVTVPPCSHPISPSVLAIPL